MLGTSEDAVDILRELVDRVGRVVCQGGIGVGPNMVVRIELQLRGREAMDQQASIPMQYSPSTALRWICEPILSGTPALYVECGGTESILSWHGMIPLYERYFVGRYICMLPSDKAKRESLLAAPKPLVLTGTHPAIGDSVRATYGKWLQPPILDEPRDPQENGGRRDASKIRFPEGVRFDVSR